MANMVDYLKWRGDLSFVQDPFNEVDNLILAELVYTDFGGIVPGPGIEADISLGRACELFFARHTDEEIMALNSSTKVAPFLMRDMVKSRRFQNCRLTGYVNEIDLEFQSQFAAVTFLLEDGTAYVAYRGTDNTIVGWKEDFNMSFLRETAGQVKAAEYLNQNFADTTMKLRIGGHSKGGNFAVYASVFCDEALQSRILTVYSNDGPGFLEEVTRLPQYQRMLPRILSTTPEASIVGMLLENPLEHQVVKSSQTGAMQHDAMSWEVLGNRFVKTDNIKESSIMLDQTLKHWIYGMETEERKEFVDTLFSVLGATGAMTLDELQQQKLVLVNEMTKALSELPQEKRQAFINVLFRFISSGGESLANKAYASGENFANNVQEAFSKIIPSRT